MVVCLFFYFFDLIRYDLPDRDCAAAASNGEITCADNTCAAVCLSFSFCFIINIYFY
jgi:hypothetical protein